MDNGTASGFGAEGAPSPQFAILNYFFPGYSFLTAALHNYLGADFNIYLPVILAVLGTTVVWGYISQTLWSLVEQHLMSSVKIRTDDEIYNMFMMWMSRQKFSQNSRRFIVNTDVSSRSNYVRRYYDSDDEDEDDDEYTIEEDDPSNPKKQKQPLHYTPAFGSHYFWFRGQPLLFERIQNREQITVQNMADREELSVSCFGRSPYILKELLLEARRQHLKKDERKTVIYRGTIDQYWQRCMSRLNRPFSTVILDEKIKKDLIADAADYLNPATRRWYANRGIPYRRGYLLHGPPGTGKSSLSLALAGYFRMKIYIVNLSSPSTNEESLTSLFADLPTRCVVLLEDIDSAGLTHTRDESTATSSLPQEEPSDSSAVVVSGATSAAPTRPTGRLSLSGLLNILDGVASQEGRILIMTTNHVEKLDQALIRPGRVDMMIPFGLADRSMTAAIFRAIYAPYENEIAPSYGSSTKKKTGEPVDEVEVERKRAEKKAEVTAKVDELAERFSAEVPELEFSPAQIQGLLLRHKRDPDAAIESVEQWVEQTRRDKKAKEEEETKAEKRRQEAEEKSKAEEKKKAEESGGKTEEKTEKEKEAEKSEEKPEEKLEEKLEENNKAEKPGKGGKQALTVEETSASKSKRKSASDSGYETP